jgi:hypothetical protein
VFDGIQTKKLKMKSSTPCGGDECAVGGERTTVGVHSDKRSKNARRYPAFSPFASMVKYASLGILVCSDTRNVVLPGFWVQDCSAATQNLLIAAHALGLGAV